jgi:hypothetical protein
VLIKTRSLIVHADPESQREELLRLLALIEDPREMGADVRKSERRWLRDAQQRLDFSSPSLLHRDTQTRAELAFRLLIRE